MKKMMIALLLMVAISSVASAQMPFIGMYADDSAAVCHIDLPVYVTTSVYFFASIGSIPAITAVEFSVSNLPLAADALVTPNWATPLVIGDLGYGIALAFSPAAAGPDAFLGTVDFFALNDLGADFVMEVLPSNDSGMLVVVDDVFETHEAMGGMFTFNCATGDCECEGGTATDDNTISSIKALY